MYIYHLVAVVEGSKITQTEKKNYVKLQKPAQNQRKNSSIRQVDFFLVAVVFEFLSRYGIL